MRAISSLDVPRFDRAFFSGAHPFTRIGDGAYGGKASGLLFIHADLVSGFPASAFPPFAVSIPRLVVLATDVFDRFLAQNNLREVAHSDASDTRIANAFQRAQLPVDLVGDLRALVEQVHTPLAVRSSSLLEDALDHPFAGVYGTKMIPNNQFDADTRFRKLVEAIKYVWASTFFDGAKDYGRMIGRDIADEKMAVIIQEVVGRRHGDRYYPDVAGVARSYSFYRTGNARPEDGVVNLALGLGKTIVDGGLAWTYSPAYPHQTPPFASPRALLSETQSTFWAINMGKPPAYDPVAETEYLVQANLQHAADDETLDLVASTYDPQSDRLVIGRRPGGAWAITFAPLLALDELPLNALVKGVLARCEEALGAKVEIEFALTIEPASRTSPLAARFGFLQVRPMAVSDQVIDVPVAALESAEAIVASETVMGNGLVEGVADIVYVKPAAFEARHTRAIARELGGINRGLVASKRPYVLIGFGRWGSSDPWLGIPVEWSAINGATAVVEATLPNMNVEPSQGSHFFHNISSFHVSYFSVPHSGRYAIDFDWLAAQPAVAETEFVRHVTLATPVAVKVDGRTGRGVVAR
ncbi:MAG: PEP/pyruvate-binding domain-containing protein [Bacteroidales bacterium]